MILAARAFIVRACRGISSDYQEIVAGPQALMARTRGQDEDIASLAVAQPPAIAAEPDLYLSSGDTEDLVDP
jgi:hypothetical protein